MPYYDEIFKHVTGEFPYALAALALKTPEVEVGKRLATEHVTVRMHHSDMTFPVRCSVLNCPAFLNRHHQQGERARRFSVTVKTVQRDFKLSGCGRTEEKQ